MTKKSIQFGNSSNRKVYPNPTISEALCEIFFSTDEKFDQKINKLKDSLEASYPDVKDDPIKHFKAIIENSGLSVKEETTQRSVFKHVDRNHLLQVSPGLIAINEIGEYPTWDVFKNDIKVGYDAVSDVFPVTSINRVGLRYINLIPRVDRAEEVFNWLVPNKYYPDGILNSKKGFLSKCEFDLEQNRKLVVTISESLQQDHFGAIVFDIDAICVCPEGADADSLFVLLEDLHDIISDVFHTSLSKKYQSRLMDE